MEEENQTIPKQIQPKTTFFKVYFLLIKIVVVLFALNRVDYLLFGGHWHVGVVLLRPIPDWVPAILLIANVLQLIAAILTGWFRQKIGFFVLLIATIAVHWIITYVGIPFLTQTVTFDFIGAMLLMIMLIPVWRPFFGRRELKDAQSRKSINDTEKGKGN